MFPSSLTPPFLYLSLSLAINLPLRHDKYLWSNRNYFDALSLIKNGNCRLSKMKTIPPHASSSLSSPLPPQPLLKCIKNIWTAFSPLGDLLNCVCKKALPRKWRLHSFYLLDLWQKAGENGGREWGLTAYFTCHNDKDSLPEMRNMIARKSSSKKAKEETKSSKCYRFPLSYFGECEPKSSSESSTAAYSPPPPTPLLLFPFHFVLCWVTDKSLKHLLPLEGSANWPSS